MVMLISIFKGTVARGILQIIADGFVLVLTIIKILKTHNEATTVLGNFSVSEFLLQDGRSVTYLVKN